MILTLALLTSIANAGITTSPFGTGSGYWSWENSQENITVNQFIGDDSGPTFELDDGIVTISGSGEGIELGDNGNDDEEFCGGDQEVIFDSGAEPRSIGTWLTVGDYEYFDVTYYVWNGTETIDFTHELTDTDFVGYVTPDDNWYVEKV